MLHRRVYVFHHTHKRNFNSTNAKQRQKYAKKRKLEKQTDHRDFLGTKRFNDKSYSPLSKFLWILIIFSCITGSTIQIYFSCITYFEDPVTIEIKLTERISVIFPSTTICNLRLYYLLINPHNIKNNINFTDTSNLWYNLGMDPTNMSVLTSCGVDSDVCFKPVKESMTVELVNATYGSCILLSMKNKMAFIGTDKSVSFKWGPTVEFSDDYNSFLFLIHSDKFHHVYDFSSCFENLKHGSTSEYRVYSREFRNLNSRKKPCMSGEIAHTCLNNCIDKEILNVVKCGLPFLINTSLPQCSSLEETQQNYKKAALIWFNMASYLRNCSCQRKCIHVQYTLSKNYLPNQPDNATKLFLLYAGDKDEIITEKKMMTIQGLFSDIGGTLGLYLGLSIFAIVDFLESLIRNRLQFKCLK